MKFIKIVLLFLILIGIFLILDNGLNINSYNQFIQPLILAVFATLGLFYPNQRSLTIRLSLILFLVMVLVYLFNILDFANLVGSLGFGILLLTILTYLPQLIKKGYIEKY